ncbi:MAG: hypothetical protein KAV00_17985 [Phycisphaerae bacterium]|nr:hypothetical protein [Phycisphaerae bacterium]
MRVFRSKLNWVLAGLFLAIMTNGCGGPGGCSRKLTPTMEAKYQEDRAAYDKKKDKDALDRKKNLWEELVRQNAPDSEIEKAHLSYLEALQDYNNPGEKPTRDDEKYDDPHRPMTGHKHAQRPTKTIPPTTSTPPKPPKPPCTDHHH